MTNDLEQQLRSAFHEDAHSARLVSPDQPFAANDLQPTATKHRTRTGILIAAFAAATLLTAAVGIAAVRNSRPKSSEVGTFASAPTDQPVPGTTPSTPSPASAGPEPTPQPPAPTSLAPPAAPTIRSQTDLYIPLNPATVSRLPTAPIEGRVAPAAVWTGTEVIVWGGAELLEPTGETPLDDGAALNLATGTWRLIAPAPVAGRSYPASAWTGTEMIVWGGSHDGTTVADGAAYNPASDTWRRLPEAPIDSAMKPTALWTGDEVIVVGGARSVGGGVQPIQDAAAYNPVTNAWRRLADAPGVSLMPYPQAVWTGTTILTTITPSGPDDIAAGPSDSVLASYDLQTDSWQIIDDEASNPFLVGIPDADGVTRTVAAIPSGAETPIDLLGSLGNRIGALPNKEALSGSGDVATGVWVGCGDTGEVAFWMGGAEGQSFRPATGTWRSFPAGDLPARVDGALLAAGDVLVAWGGFVTGPPTTAADDGIVYRVPGCGS